MHMFRASALLPQGRWLGAVAVWLVWCCAAWSADLKIEDFAGSYSGSAQVVRSSGEIEDRDLSVEISETDRGFRVSWRTTTYRASGGSRQKSYSIEFLPTQRDGIFAAAMRKNVFGHSVQNDPMKGEPYVWARIVGATMTVYSLFVDQQGDYELQEYARTRVEGGLEVKFKSLRDGQVARRVTAFLTQE